MTDDETSEPIDLSALDPTQPPAAFARRVARVRHAAQGTLWRRRQAATPLGIVERWRMPLMAAMLLVMLASMATLRAIGADPATDSVAISDEIAEAFGVTGSVGEALTGESGATTALLGGFDQ
jgi:hypothetical protein